MGDFNVALNPRLDRTENREYCPKAQEILQRIIEEAELIDLWQVLNPEVKRYSYIRKKHKNSLGVIGSRIDYAPVTPGISHCIPNIEYKYGYKTDHSMLYLELGVCDRTRGPGYWKFNNSMLRDVDFVN